MSRKYKRKKSGRQPYFTLETQEAIVEYCNMDGKRQKDKLFADKIYPAFSKLVEFNLRVYKWPYYMMNITYEDAHSEVVAHITEKIGKFNPEYGSLAYSYFNMIVRNFLIAANEEAYEELKIRDGIEAIDATRDLLIEKHISDYQDHLCVFMDEYINKLESELAEHFTDKNDMIIANAMLEMFKYRQNIEDFNKKAIYIMIRDMTGVRIETITPVVKKMKSYFDEYKQFYDKHNHLDTSGSFW